MLRSRLVRDAAVAVGVACAVAVVIVLLVLVPQKRASDLAVLEAEAAGLAKLLASLAPPTPDFEVMMSALIEPFFEEARLEGVATFDADGTPWLSLGASKPELRATLAEVSPDSAIVRSGSDPRYLDFAWSMAFNNDPTRRYVMVARMDATDLNARTAAFTVRSVAATVGIGVMLALGTILFLSLRILRPVLELKQRMQEAAADPTRPDRYALPDPGVGAGEIGAMVASFNVMTRRIGDAVDTLHRSEIDLRAAKERAEATLTELQRAQSKLIEAEKMAALGGLVAGVAHEINTPVGNALGAVSHLERRSHEVKELFDAGKLRKPDAEGFIALSLEATEIALANIHRAGALVQSFKQVAVDRTSDHRRRFALDAYVDELLLSLRPQLRRTPHRVEVAVPSGIELDSYPGGLAQVLTNLLVNATLHAFPDGRAGTLSIEAAAVGPDHLTVRVADDGQGIAPEALPHVFEPFFTTKRGAGGTGLGLHIVYNIVTQQLGGTITVESGAGQGAAFTLALPRRAPAERSLPADALTAE